MKTEKPDVEYGGRLWPEGQSPTPPPPSRAGPLFPWKLIAGIGVGAMLVLVMALLSSRSVTLPTEATTSASATTAAAPLIGQVDQPTSQTASTPAVSRVKVYVALIQHLYQKHWEQVYLLRRICTQFPLGDGKCVDTLSSAEQAAIVAALPNLDLTFAKPPRSIFMNQANQNRFAQVTVGPIVEGEASVQVEAGYYCVYTCGYGTTYVMRQRSGVWKVTGQVGDYWIS